MTRQRVRKAYDRERASRRYRALVEQLGEEAGHAHGWKTRVAERLGVTPGYISKVLRGNATAVTVGTLDKATASLRISPRFFFEQMDEPVRFRDWTEEQEMIDDGERAAARMRDLIEWMFESNRDSMGLRGSQRRIADVLGCHPSYISRLRSGECRSIGPDVALRAARRIGMNPAFFDAPDGADPSEFFEGSPPRLQQPAPSVESGKLDPELEAMQAILKLTMAGQVRVLSWCMSRLLPGSRLGQALREAHAKIDRSEASADARGEG